MTSEVPELRVPLGRPEPRGVAVVVRGHKLLVMARRLDGLEYAVLPGGCIEPGETAEQAAVRELTEECSLRGTPVRRLFDGDHGGRPAAYVLVNAPDGEPVLGGPEAEAQSDRNQFQPVWVTAGELPSLGLLPEGIDDLLRQAVWPLRVGEVEDGEWPVLERLWQLYQHDLSEFRHGAPGPDGAFVAGRLPDYAGRVDRVAYLARLGEVPCGFALVRWVVPFQDENPRAAAFWRRLAAEVMSDVSEQTLPVPGKRHLPPDVWLSGRVG